MFWWKKKTQKQLAELQPEEVDTVPILGPEDFCRGEAHNGDTSCLLGWMEHVFGYGTDLGGKDIGDTILDTIHEVFPNQYFGSIPEFNDRMIDGNGPQIPRGTLASIWNRAMAKLGFIVGNPECDPKTGELL